MPSSSRKWVRLSRPSASTTPGTPTTTRPSGSAAASVASISEDVTDSIAAIAASALGPPSSTSWRTRMSPTRSQTAPRAKRAPRSRPRTSAASGTGSKKTAPKLGPAGAVLGLAHETRLEQRLQRERDGRLRDPGPARDLGPRDRRIGAHGLEHGALIQPLEQRRSCAVQRVIRHLVKNPNGKCRLQAHA